jgi:acetoin utilization deacetylase AcuC-like enzyme
MSTALITHPACLEHEVPPGHPERPARLRAVLDALQEPPFNELRREEAPRATLDDVALIHDRAYAQRLLEAVPSEGFAQIDPDTFLSPGSGEAALRAVGAAMHGVDLVMQGTVRNAFCAVRPPGHHAEPDQAMGFCFFNSIAIAAAYARAHYELKRIAVIDFDVHHGNGTEAAFAADPNLFYASTHQSPLYPGTGHADTRGVAGNILNLPLAAGTAGPAFRAIVAQRLLPLLEEFAPDFILISAGFDAHLADPLANLCLSPEDFGWITAEVCALADRLCAGRVVSALEGGYDLGGLAASAQAHVRALMAA